MDYYDTRTSLFIADTEQIPLSYLPSAESVRESARELILSASGWRKVFAKNGDEESFTEETSPENIVIASTAALTIAELFLEQAGDHSPTIAVAIDSRPTGPLLADAIIRTLLSKGISVRYLFISPAPELMAYVKSDTGLDGFVYVSASHNPVGHNGLKFGLSDGAVAGGETSRGAIARFEKLLLRDDLVESAHKALTRGSSDEYERILREIPVVKSDAEQSYSRLSLLVAAGAASAAGGAKEDEDLLRDFSKRFSDAISKAPIGILGELNGSARATTIDRDFLGRFGLSYRALNDRPRQIVHPIVPEGKNLDLCKEKLRELHGEEPAFLLGYVPDNDGDRGNIVYFDSSEEMSRTVKAQEVFALSVLSELADLRSRVDSDSKAAVVVNGPTSMRIDRIAGLLSVEVYRSETGEANVVSKAQELRREGYTVRILGEGSNGGNISHPSSVRDPLNTLVSLIKLLRLPAAFELWKECRTGGEAPPAGFTAQGVNGATSLRELLDSLPPFVTTGAYEPEAKMQVSTRDHALLKSRYEEIFAEEWELHREQMKRDYGIVSWREEQYEGTETRRGAGPEFRSEAGKGGLKIVFSNEAGVETDFIWMRGSGTEPVFRVMADCEGSDESRHDRLLAWHRSIIERADTFAGKRPLRTTAD